MGCAVVGSDTEPVREFITHDRNGLLASFFDPPGLARTVLELLENQRLNARLRASARAYAEENLDMGDYIAAYRAAIERMVGRPIDDKPTPATWPNPPVKAAKAAAKGKAKAPAAAAKKGAPPARRDGARPAPTAARKAASPGKAGRL
jgi:hypothetical protein